MKTNRTIALILFAFLLGKIHSQASFTIPATLCANEVVTLTASSGTIANSNFLWYANPAGGQIVSVASSVTTISFLTPNLYTVGVNVNNGIDFSYAQQTVNVLPSPTLIASQSSFTSCITSNSPLASKPVTLSVAGSSNYTWSIPPTQGNPNGPQNIVSPTVSTCYSASAQNSLGCTSIAALCVSVAPRPTIQVTPQFTAYCLPSFSDPDPMVTLTMTSSSSSSQPYTYLWSGFGFVSSPYQNTLIAAPMSTESFTAELRDSFGCVSLPAIATVSVSYCTGMGELIGLREELVVFPNPATDVILFQLNSGAEIQSVKLYDNTGNLITSAIGSNQLDMSQLASGIYAVEVVSARSQTTKRVVRE